MVTRKDAMAKQLFYVPPGCPSIFPRYEENPPVQLLKTSTSYYCAVGDGMKSIFTDQDALAEYSTSPILDPQCVSIVNLFINGMIQPHVLYDVSEGILYVKTTDIPKTGVTIVLQFIKIWLDAHVTCPTPFHQTVNKIE